MNNNERDYYEVLGVERQASEQTIKSAYRKLAMQHHPDRNPENKEESEEKFKEITEAYSVLADAQKRAAYDQFGHAGVGSSGGWTPDFSSTIFSDFEDLFGDFFGIGGFGRGPRGRRRAARGADLRYDLEITLEEAAQGWRPKSRSPGRKPAPSATAAAQRKAVSRPLARPAAGAGKSGTNRASSRFHEPARIARGWGR